MIYIYTYIYIYTCIYVYTYLQSQTHTHAWCIHEYMNTHSDAYVHDIMTYIIKHIHTVSQRGLCFEFLPWNILDANSIPQHSKHLTTFDHSTWPLLTIQHGHFWPFGQTITPRRNLTILTIWSNTRQIYHQTATWPLLTVCSNFFDHLVKYFWPFGQTRDCPWCPLAHSTVVWRFVTIVYPE